MSSTADLGDYELSRSYPLILSAASAALELAQIPGYATANANANAISRFNNAPLGTTWILYSATQSGTTDVLPLGSIFRKLTRTAYGLGGRVTRVASAVNTGITINSLVDPFVTSLVATGAADSIVVGGTLLDGAGGAVSAATLIEVEVGGIASAVLSVGSVTGTTQYFVPAAAGGGAMYGVLSNSSGVFAATFTYTGGTPSGSVPVVFRYKGLTATTTATVT